jgi:hypothetical protein
MTDLSQSYFSQVSPNKVEVFMRRNDGTSALVHTRQLPESLPTEEDTNVIDHSKPIGYIDLTSIPAAAKLGVPVYMSLTSYDKYYSPVYGPKKFAAKPAISASPPPALLSNAIVTPDGTVLQSFHRHDYKEYKDANGETYMVDGGLDYLRRNITKTPATEISVTDESDFDLIREQFQWGTRGKDGLQPLTWVALRDLDTSHIEAILETQTQLSPAMVRLFKDELIFRQP